MALALDGHASATSSPTSTPPATLSVTLTTTQTNDVIVALVTFWTNQTVLTQTQAPGVMSVSGGGLTWGLRNRTRLITSISSFPIIAEEWVAKAPAALAAQVITATVPFVGSNNYLLLDVFGVSGADTDAIFDVNASLPAISAVAAGGAGTHPVNGISTTAAPTFEVAMLSTAAGGTVTATPDSGFTLIDSLWQSSSNGGQQSEYTVNSLTLPAITQNVFASQSTITANYVAFVDALVASGASRSGPAFVNSGGGTTVNAAAITPALPGSRVNGNLLLAFCSLQSSSAPPTPVWPAGWTPIENWTIGNQGGSKAWCYVTGSETAPAITWSGAINAAAEVLQFTNVSSTSPIGQSSHNSASSAAASCAAITTSAASSLVVNYFSAFLGLAPALPTPWRPRSTGGQTSPGFWVWHTADQFLPAASSTSASVSQTLFASAPWVNMTTELQAQVIYPSGAGVRVYANDAKTAGKYYFEITVTSKGATSANIYFGVMLTSGSYAGIVSGPGSLGVVSTVHGGEIWTNGVDSGRSIGTAVTNDVIGIAVDFDNGKAWFKPVAGSQAGVLDWNGYAIGTGHVNDPTNNVNGIAVMAGPMVPAVVFAADTTADVMTGNFGSSAFSGTAPTNFTAGWPRTATAAINYIERLQELYYPNGYISSWQVDAGISYFGTGATTFWGAQHLAGLTVTGVADGAVIPPFTMPVNGTFTLPQAASTVTIGLAFTPQLQTLAIDLGEPTAQGKRKKITAVTVRVKDALGLAIGGSAASVVPMKDLVVGNVGTMTNGVVAGFVTGDARTIIDQNWTVPGQYFIQQSQPYPASILGVIPEITVGDTQK